MNVLERSCVSRDLNNEMSVHFEIRDGARKSGQHLTGRSALKYCTEDTQELWRLNQGYAGILKKNFLEIFLF